MATGIRLASLSLFVAASLAVGTWTAQPDMLYARSDHTADVVSNGTQKLIVVFGGCVSANTCPVSLDSCFCTQITSKTTAFDPERGTWFELTSAPVARYRHMSAAIGSLLFVFGGRDLNDNIINDVHVFNLTSNSWDVSTSWLNATSDGTSFVYNGTIFAVGGYDAIYDASNATWIFRPLSSSPLWVDGLVAPMKMPRGDSCSAIVNGVGYVLGGWTDGNFCTPLAEVEGYNFQTNTWSVKAVMRVGGGDKSCSGLHNQLHVFGGEQKDVNCSRISTPVTDVEVYDSTANTWTIETSLNPPRFRFAAVDWVSSNGAEKLFIFGGQAPYNTTSESFPVLGLVAVFNDVDAPTAPPAVSSMAMVTGSWPVVVGAVLISLIVACNL